MGPGTRRVHGFTAVALAITFAATLLVSAPASGRPSTAADATPTAQASESGEATQPSPYAGRVGITDHMVWYDEPTIEATYRSLIDGGITMTREDFLWEFIEPSNGTFSWSRTDRVMRAASRTGMDVLAILAYSASWSSSQSTTRALPASDAEYAEYAAAVTRRYGLGGTFWSSNPDLEPQPVRAVEIWNEPSGYWFANPEPDPARYASMALAASEAIHEVDPAMKVLIDATLLQVRRDGRLLSWIDEVLRAEPALIPHIGAYSSHPYPYPQTRGPYAEASDARWDFRQVELVRQVTTARGAARPIWITEIGWSTATDASGTVSEATQAQYVVQAIERGLGEFGDFVERVYLYSFDRDSSDQTDREGFFGLRHRDGTPKPSWLAVQDLLAPSSAPAPAPTTTTTRPEAPPSTTTTVPDVQLGPSRVAVRVFGSILYYDLA